MPSLFLLHNTHAKIDYLKATHLMYSHILKLGIQAGCGDCVSNVWVFSWEDERAMGSHSIISLDAGWDDSKTRTVSQSTIEPLAFSHHGGFRKVRLLTTVQDSKCKCSQKHGQCPSAFSDPDQKSLGITFTLLCGKKQTHPARSQGEVT